MRSGPAAYQQRVHQEEVIVPHDVTETEHHIFSHVNKPPSSPKPLNIWLDSETGDKKAANVRGDFQVAYPFAWQNDDLPNEQLVTSGELPLFRRTPESTPVAHPELIAAYGLYHFCQFMDSGDIQSRYISLRMADWLVENLVAWQNNFFSWPIPIAEPFLGCDAPRVSAKTHGLAISLLLRTAYVNNDARYEEGAARAIRLFFLPAESGGLARRFEDGSLAFEQVPVTPRCLNLASFLYSIIGIHDYASYFDDHSLKTIFDSAVDSLRTNINQYDLDGWILQDLHPSRRYAEPAEIDLVCRLLEALSSIVSDDSFKARATTWKAYPGERKNRLRYRSHRLLERIQFRFFPQKYNLPPHRARA